MSVQLHVSRFSKITQIFSDAGQQPCLRVGQEPQPDWGLRLHVKQLYGTEKAFGPFSKCPHFSSKSPSLHTRKTSRHDIIGINQAQYLICTFKTILFSPCFVCCFILCSSCYNWMWNISIPNKSSSLLLSNISMKIFSMVPFNNLCHNNQWARLTHSPCW